MENDLEPLVEADIASTTPLPLISSSTALTFLQDLTHYFHSLPVSSLLLVPGSSSIDGFAKFSC